MSVSVERLRVWLLVGAALLVLVIAAFLGYARYRTKGFLKQLPARLGADIQQETNGFTYSQSDGPNGRTIYTIHASKMVQRKDGKVTLHDVGILLYGRGNDTSNRLDRIYGNEFEYDQNAGLIRAVGEVHIDLQAPAPVDAKARTEYAKGHDLHGGEAQDERLIHVKTSGLVFLQKLGVAATDQDLEFEYNGLTGHAHGADYSSDTGVLVLQSAVKMNGLKQGKPVVLTASRAEINRQRQQVVLNRAEYTVVGGESGSRMTKAQKVTADLRHDGSIERARGEGGVSLTDDDGTTLTAARGDARLNGASQPQMVVLSGDVKYVVNNSVRQAQGEAAEGKADFDSAGALKHVTMTGGVHLHERSRIGDVAQNAWSERELTSVALDLVVGTGADRRAVLQQATAMGSAKLTVVNPPVVGAKAGHKGAVSSSLAGDLLTADFVLHDGGTHLRNVHGVGHTALRRVNDAGAVATSSGDTLEAEFRSLARSAAAAQAVRKGGTTGPATEKSGLTGQGRDEVSMAVQQGHVLITNTPAANPVAKPGDTAAAKDSGSGEQQASADRAVYDGTTDKATLTGKVQMSDADSVVSAERVVMEQQSGDVVADGSVRASYRQQGNTGDTVHVLAARGELKHDAGLAIFYGATGAPARLWQGASQVAAPVLQFEQRERRMVAHGDAKDAGLAVHAVFVNAAAAATGTGTGLAAKSGEGAKPPVPIRVASREMRYDDTARRGNFSGGVVVEDADGTMRSQQAVVYLKAVESKGGAGESKGGTDRNNRVSAAPGAFMGGSVERMVASGRVDVVQPGRRASGEQVVYTAADGMFVMTGLPGLPPMMMDEARGAVTGASLRFHAGDNSVVVSNGPDSGTGQRVRSETRVKQ